MSTQSLKPQQPLTDDEASKEMKKMVAFIMQEAAEKTRELHIRADEEFNIEKAKIVHQETVAIEQQFARKLKQAEVKRRMYDNGGPPISLLYLGLVMRTLIRCGRLLVRRVYR